MQLRTTGNGNMLTNKLPTYTILEMCNDHTSTGVGYCAIVCMSHRQAQAININENILRSPSYLPLCNRNLATVIKTSRTTVFFIILGTVPGTVPYGTGT